MSALVLDVWNDLREKRLAVVAAALVLVLFVVPVVLGRGSADDDPEVAAPVPAAGAKAPVVGAVDTQNRASDLGVFDPKNPFQPGTPQGSSGGGTATVDAPAPGGAIPSPTGDTQGGGATSAPFGGSGGTEPPASSTPGATSPADPERPRSKLYTYVIDIKFGRSGRERKRRGVKRLRVLPDERQPLLVFLGVKADRTRAIFLADSTASQSGEGKCHPDVDTCTFIYLSTNEDNNEHFITDSDGHEYRLELTGIRAVEVESKKSSSSRSARNGDGQGRRQRRAESGKKTPFHLPVFADGRR